MAFEFENLNVWQRAIDLSGEIYQLAESFLKKEMFVLTSQMQRAALSISTNF
jgi:four helix bundle protein